MSTMLEKLPAYGMPVPEGPVGRPEKSRGGPPMGDMPQGGPGGPGGPGGMPGGPGGPEGMPGGPGGPEGMPGGPGGPEGPGGMPGGPGGPKIAKPCPPQRDPNTDPGAVPGADCEPGKPGPGFGGPPKAPPFDRCESLDVIDGRLYQAPQPYAAYSAQQLDDHAMKNGSYHTDAICLNGIYVGGKSEYAIENCEFTINGDGINDFAGIGSAIMVDDDSRLEVTNTQVTATGCIRPCTVAAGNSTLIVRSCTLTGHCGELPPTYVKRIASGMMEPPPGLEIGGTSRTHLSMGNSKAYFYDSTIYTKNWAALSTDSSQGDLYLEANNCDVICEEVGYGTYADNGCYNYLNDCRVKTATHAAIIAGEASVSFTNCDVVSGQYCSMIHSVRGSSSEVTASYIQGGSFDIGECLFFVKSTNAYLKAQGAKIKAPYILHTEVNRDDARTQVAPEDKLKVYGVKLVLQDMELEGDIVHEEPERCCAVTMENIQLRGKIQDCYITLKASHWFATADSTVTLVGGLAAGSVDAPRGVTIRANAGDGCQLLGEYPLASGGTLVVG